MTISITTWNVNSIKSRLHALLPWLKEAAPDVVLLQELKTSTDTFPYMEIEELGYNVAVYGQKTYNGVAILSKYPIEDVRTGLPTLHGEVDEEARYIEGVISLHGKAMRVASVYVPNGQSPESEKFVYKLAFLDRLYHHLQSLLKHEEILVVGGDYNVAPAPLDVYDPKKLDGTTCYHPREREKLHTILHLGMTDAFRSLHPTSNAFSWWDYRGRGYEGGEGMRIDYLLLSPQARDILQTSEILESFRAGERPSDHAPVMSKFLI